MPEENNKRPDAVQLPPNPDLEGERMPAFYPPGHGNRNIGGSIDAKLPSNKDSKTKACSSTSQDETGGSWLQLDNEVDGASSQPGGHQGIKDTPQQANTGCRLPEAPKGASTGAAEDVAGTAVAKPGVDEGNKDTLQQAKSLVNYPKKKSTPAGSNLLNDTLQQAKSLVNYPKKKTTPAAGSSPLNDTLQQAKSLVDYPTKKATPAGGSNLLNAAGVPTSLGDNKSRKAENGTEEAGITAQDGTNCAAATKRASLDWSSGMAPTANVDARPPFDGCSTSASPQNKGPTRGLGRTTEEREAKQRNQRKAPTSQGSSDEVNVISKRAAQYSTTGNNTHQEQNDTGQSINQTNRISDGGMMHATSNPRSFADITDDLMPQAMPTAPQPTVSTQRPGAFRGSASSMERSQSLYKGGQRVLGREGDAFQQEDSTRHLISNVELPPPPSRPDLEDIEEDTNQFSGTGQDYFHHSTGAESSAISGTTFSKNGLAVARSITQESKLNLVEAQEVDPEDSQWKENREQKRRKCKLIGCAIATFCCIVLALSLGFTLSRKGEKVLPQTLAPSNAPSSAPTGTLDQLLEELPNYTSEGLKTYLSPQWQAWDWLAGHPDLPDMEEWRKRQLFALVTFFYDMDGPNWPGGMKDNWLLYDKHECYWFSGRYGFIGEDGEYEVDGSYEELGEPCTEDNKFQVLVILDLEPSRQQQNIPPEIALLTSLSALSLPLNHADASIAEFLPKTIYQLRNLTHLDLHENHLHGAFPSELGLLTNMLSLDLSSNGLTGGIPSEVGSMTGIAEMTLFSNSLADTLPSELGLLTRMTKILLYNNTVTGLIPTEVATMSSMAWLDLTSNNFTGGIPSELGLMTNMEALYLDENLLTGPIPSEIGQLDGVVTMDFKSNSLTGFIPTELGLMTNMTKLLLSNNTLTGPVPVEVGLLTSLKYLSLENNALTGSIPDELVLLAANGSYAGLTLANNSLSGTVPESLCSLGMYDPSLRLGLSFDCSAQLCGCCWCPCPGRNYSTDCQTKPFDPSYQDEEWPGEFPTPVNRSNIVSINIRTDTYPEETILKWSLLSEAASWELLDSEGFSDASMLHSYTKWLDSNALYKLEVFDAYGDGICCEYGFGWCTITNSTPSHDHAEGTVIWEALGYIIGSSLEVLIWVDGNGQAQHVEYVPGQGYALIQEGTLITVASETGQGRNSSSGVVPSP